MFEKKKKLGCMLSDWGNTLMRDFPEYDGPMYTWPTVELVTNAESSLAKLHEDWFIALATNAKDSTKEEIQKSFSRVGVLDYLDEIFCFRSVGYSKPSPQFFDCILANVNFDKSQIFMVGDDYQSDIEGTHRMGIKRIWLNLISDDVVENEHCKTIWNLSELPSCLISF